MKYFIIFYLFIFKIIKYLSCTLSYPLHHLVTVRTRVVQGSYQVRFMPNPDSTWMRWVKKNLTQNRLGDLVRFLGLGLVDFGLIRVNLGFIIGSKSGRMRSGWNLTRSIEICPRFCRITVRSRRIWSEIHNTSPKRIKDSIWVGCHGFWNELTTDPHGVGLLSSKPAGVVRLGGGGSVEYGFARLSGLSGLLDSPSRT